MDHLPQCGKRERICLLLFTCSSLVPLQRGFLFLWVLWMGCVILLCHSLSLPYYYLANMQIEVGANINRVFPSLAIKDLYERSRPDCAGSAKTPKH